MGKGELTKNSAIVFAAMLVSNICSFLFSILMGRNMPMEMFGGFSALLSIQLIFSVLTGAFILYYTRESAKLPAGDGRLSRLYEASWRGAGKFSLGSFLLVAGSGFLWAELLSIESLLYTTLAGLLIGTYFLQAVPLAFVRGLQRFYLLFYGLGLAGILKLLMGWFAVRGGISIDGGLWSLIGSALFSVGLMHLLLRRIIPPTGEGDDTPMTVEDRFIFSSRAILALLFPMLFMNVDMLLVRSLMEPVASGHYASFGVIGRVIFIIGQVVAIALFPATVSRDSALEEGEAKNNDLVYRALLLTLFGGGSVTAVCFLFGDMLLKLLFKIEPGLAGEMLPYYCCMVTFIAILYIEANHRLARQQYGFLWVSSGLALLQAVVLFRFAPDLMGALKGMVVLFGLGAAIRFGSLLMGGRRDG